MRSWPDKSSPWGKQIRFEPHEFEVMMDEMRARAGNESFDPSRGVNVDLVLQQWTGSDADYVELPVGMMGRTKFSADGSAKVEISRQLSDEAEHDPIARRRLRSTVAHECGHVACHGHLYIKDTETLNLFSSGSNSPHNEHGPIMCRHEVVRKKTYDGQWWEFQANQCMSALLLPRSMTSAAVRSLLADGGYSSGEACIAKGDGMKLVRSISTWFDVSQILTFYRLQTLGFFPKDLQTKMQFAD